MAKWKDAKFIDPETGDPGGTLMPIAHDSPNWWEHRDFFWPGAGGEYSYGQAEREGLLGVAQREASGLESKMGGLESALGRFRGAEQASIQEARRAAARAMFGAAGGLGGLAGSGAVRAALSQTGMERAAKEQGIRQEAASNIYGVEEQIAALQPALEEAQRMAEPGAMGAAAVDESRGRMSDIYEANIGQGDRARYNAAVLLWNEFKTSPWPEVRAAAWDWTQKLLGAI
jgi:hypothetical protein